MYLFCVCEYIRSTICVQYAQRSEDGVGLPETGVMNGCVPPCGAGNWCWFPRALDCEDTLYDHLQKFLLCPSVWLVTLGQLRAVPSAVYSGSLQPLSSLWFCPACFTSTPRMHQITRSSSTILRCIVTCNVTSLYIFLMESCFIFKIKCPISCMFLRVMF